MCSSQVRRLASRICPILALALLSTGCLSKERGVALERDVARLKQDFGQELGRTEQAQDRLRSIMEKATALSTRNSADVTVHVEQLQVDMAKLRGQIEELAQANAELTRQFAALKKQTAGRDPNAQPLPGDKNEVFQRASSLISGGNHEQGRRLLRHFMARYPSDARTDRAQLALGNSYYAQQKFAPAIQEYRKVIERHKQSPLVPEALYKIGMSFYQLKYCSDAANFLKELIAKHPRHATAAQARKVLKLIRRFRRNRRMCVS